MHSGNHSCVRCPVHLTTKAPLVVDTPYFLLYPLWLQWPGQRKALWPLLQIFRGKVGSWVMALNLQPYSAIYKPGFILSIPEDNK